jgi:tetrahydromethanopterin S-methyltransferase subunit G
MSIRDPFKKAFRNMASDDPMKEMREWLSARTYDFGKEMRKSVEATRYNPMSEVRDSLAALTYNPAKEMRESLEALRYDPSKEMRALLAAMRYDPGKDARQSIAEMMHGATKGIRASLAAMTYDPMKEVRESLAALTHDATKGIQASFAAMTYDPVKEGRASQSPLTRHPLEDLRALLDATEATGGIWRAASRSGAFQPVDSESTPKAENVAAEIDQVAERLKTKRDLQSALPTLIAEIKAIKQTGRQMIVIGLLYPILVGLIMSIVNPIVNYYVVRSLGKKDAAGVAAEITAPSSVGKNPRGDIRIVRSTGASVRVRPKKRAPVMARVRGGEIVILIRTQKRWALIAFADARSGVQGYGWVGKKYLSAP